MDTVFEGRTSDSPYIEMIWRGRIGRNYAPICPADTRWNLVFARYDDMIRVSAEGATTQHVPKTQPEGSEFLVIKFSLGVFMPHLSPDNLVNGDTVLPEAAGKSFWLHGAAWQLPDYDNAETFVERLVREGTLVYEPVVSAVLHDQMQAVSSRTVRRRFLRSTGLTPKVIEQIERAQAAAALLEQGASILDATYQAGYADQPHLTRSLKRFYGYTPAQIARESQAG